MKMKDNKLRRWYCKSCGMYSNGQSNSTICPFCNSKRIEKISESFKLL